MPAIDTLERALSLPRGGRFFRCALQVNAYDYAAKYRGQPGTSDEGQFIADLVAKCVALDVRVLAVTDHNSVDCVDRIRDSATVAGICVLPGFEVSSSEGVHILCVYPPGAPVSKLRSYLGELGIHDAGDTTHLSSKSLSELLSCVWQRDGIPIAAHVSQENGLLHVLHGQARINAWKDRNLIAVQIPGALADTPSDKHPILANTNAEYRREPGAGPRLALAVVNAKDIASPDDLDDPGATCWIKMSEPSIEGLRQAFLDPESRIRLASDPSPEPHTEILAIGWQGGFLDESAIHFSEGLNVLIGGRGTGKSTVIESLRCALGLEPIGEEAKKVHDGIVRNVLRSGTKISLCVRSHSPNARTYRIERTIPDPPVVRNEAGTVLNLTPTDVLPRIDMFGQHEISEITKNPESLTALLERFVEHDDAVLRRKQEVVRELDRSRIEILQLQREQSDTRDRLAALPGLEETLKRFREAGVEERLKDRSLLVREEQVMKTAGDRAASLRPSIEAVLSELPLDTAFLSGSAIGDLPGKLILSEAAPVLERLSSSSEEAIRSVGLAISSAEQEIKSIQQKWEARKAAANAEYEKTLRELQKSRLDGEEFIRLRRRIEELRPLQDQAATLERKTTECAERRRKLLAEWEDLKADEFRRLERAAKTVSRKLADLVRVRVVFAGNRDALFELLRNRVGGRLSEAIEQLRGAPDLSLRQLADKCREGSEALKNTLGISGPQAERLAKAEPDVLMLLEELELASTTVLELNVSDTRDTPAWQALADLSTGQKATAVLLLLLLDSEIPLVVDQPEDDLDNRFITDGVVPRIRAAKRSRQFIFSSHNANIPVLADAELLVGLVATGDSGRIPVEYLGSIDSRIVRELAETTLEGGKAAFEMRRLKYGY